MTAVRFLSALALIAATPKGSVRTLDLSGPFATRSPWRLTVTQAPDIPDPIMDGNERVPGPLTLCLAHVGGRCDPALATALRLPRSDDLFGEPHELQRLAVVHPRPGRPLLLIRLGSLHSVNGNQRVGTDLYAYDRAADRFRLVYRYRTNRNNNEEVRYIKSGPLRGAVVVAEPTSDAPFGFWIAVARMDATGDYRQVLRYRSATRYGDGNPLAVIDSEMAAIHQRLGLWRLGLWRPGEPLPTPARCSTPRLIRMELWCGPLPTTRH